MSATPIKTAVQHALRYWWFWITVAVIAALSATFAAYFLLGGLIARNMPPRTGSWPSYSSGSAPSACSRQPLSSSG